MLYPIATQTRTLFSLDGIWQYRQERDGFQADITKPLEGGETIAVPGSFNDQLVTHDKRHFAGYMVYERNFAVTPQMLQERLVLRFGSVTHNCEVFVNGQAVAKHRGGFTPFEADVTTAVTPGTNRLTVRLNNLLDYTTLPVGNLKQWQDEQGATHYKVDENFDFFNYAGIQRPVRLYTTPRRWIKDVTLLADVSGSGAVIHAQVETQNAAGLTLHLSAKDAANHLVAETQVQAESQVQAEAQSAEADLVLTDVHLWEPGEGYLYNIEIELRDSEGKVVDQYIEPYGVRTVELKGLEFLINGKPFYFKGFGKHEDYPLHGRGFDEVANVLDLNLFQWIGANSFRTSHYPYSEEMMRLCDQRGIVVIDEVPAVGLMENFGFNLRGMGENSTWDVMKTHEAHREVLSELIQRDKNHACVVMWSIANEPASNQKGAYEYFKPLFDQARTEDPQRRPCTLVNIMVSTPDAALAEELCDVICLNRYQGWYVQTGDLEAGEVALRAELDQWVERFGKPILFTEYGADTVPGLHAVDDIPFTEEYQVRYYHMYHRVFDDYPNVIGEQLWNFADFETKVGINRVQGNKKGVFTRTRQPKLAAHVLRRRWQNIPNFDYDKGQYAKDAEIYDTF